MHGAGLDDTGAGAARLLADAVGRAGRWRGGGAWVLLVLHLSRLRPPAPRSYHRRIAMAMLEDTARRHDGQLFPLPSGDLALLCRGGGATGGTSSPLATEPALLPGLLGRLFRIDVTDPAILTSLWRLDEALQPALAFAAAQLVVVPEGRTPAWPPRRLPDAEREPAGQPAVIEALASLAESGELAPLLRRQTAILVGAAAGGTGLRPIFREVTIGVAALEALLSAQEGADRAGEAARDPYLFRHLAGRLDRRVLDAAHAGILPLAGTADVPTHVNLTLEGVLSAGFARLAAARGPAAPPLGVEIALIEACRDGAGFARARAVAQAARMAVVLDGVSHLALMLTRPATLGADLLKLDWSPAMAELDGADRACLARGVAGFGPARIVLHRAETEAAVRWGLAHGILRFQGRHVDAMLAAARLAVCLQAGGCTLAQCIGREASLTPAGRAGCANPALLDAAGHAEAAAA